MSDINISVTGTKRLKTAGKYCADDIVVTALGGETDIKIQDNKTVDPEKSQKTVYPDSGYNALLSVTVNKIPDEYIQPSGTLTITDNGEKDVTSYAKVAVNIPTGGGTSENLDSVLAEQESLIAELKAELANKASGGGSSSGSNKLAEIMNFEVEELTAEDLKGVRIIPYGFFEDQENLQKVTFPDTLEEINEDAFNYCINLENVIFGKSQNLSIYDNAFQLCENLQYIDFTACIDIPDISEYAFAYIPTTCELRVPASRVEDYKAATNWSNYATQIVGV